MRKFAAKESKRSEGNIGKVRVNEKGLEALLLFFSLVAASLITGKNYLKGLNYIRDKGYTLAKVYEREQYKFLSKGISL